MTDTGIRTVTHETKRLIVPLTLPYDAAIHRFEQLVPVVDTARFEQLASWNAVLELADINAPNGFMIYWKGDVTAAMALSDAGWKCTAYLMGNHTIAQRMFRHDPSAMLHAPLRVVIYADQDGHTQFVIDQPSTLFASYGRPEIDDVGAHLDQLVTDLLAKLGTATDQQSGH